MLNSHWGLWSGIHGTMGFASARCNHGAIHVYACGGRWAVGRVWWRALRCNTGHGVVGALGPLVQHVLGMCWQSLGTAGRSWAAMWCFGMCHFAPRWMMVVCVRLASFGASSRVSGGTQPVNGGTGSSSESVGV